MGNAFLFPASLSTYTAADVNGLFWVPERLGSDQCTVRTLDRLKALYENRTGMWIPCQYLPATTALGESHVILYFHGNSCDLGDMCEEMQEINMRTGRHVIQMEYPGYGICQDLVTRPDVIDFWGRAVLKMLLICGVELWQIYIMGRSIGTGPASSLARWCLDAHQKNLLPGAGNGALMRSRTSGDDQQLQRVVSPLGGLVLHSPYKSIHKIVNDYVWNVLTFLVPNYWDIETNLAALQTWNVPLLIIHGLNDEVIPVAHSKDLLNNYGGTYKLGIFSPTSHHNSYDVANDVAGPIRQLISMSASVDYAGTRVCASRQIVPLWAHKLQPPVPTPDQPPEPAALGPLSRLLFCGCGGGTPPITAMDAQSAPFASSEEVKLSADQEHL